MFGGGGLYFHFFLIFFLSSCVAIIYSLVNPGWGLLNEILSLITWYHISSFSRANSKLETSLRMTMNQYGGFSLDDPT